MGVTSTETIVTGPDRLLALVKERREITLTHASNNLRIDRTIVDHWSEVLEDQGMVAIRTNLREKVLCCPEWNEQSGDSWRMKLRQLGFKGAKTFNEEALRKREAAVANREEKLLKEMRIVTRQIEELKRYQVLKDEVEAKQAALVMEQALLRDQQARFEEEKTLMEREKYALVLERNTFDSAKAQTQRELDARGSELDERERAATQAQTQLNADLAAFAKERKQFEKRNEKLKKAIENVLN